MSAAQAILAVDDRPANLTVLERTLSAIDAELVKATSGEQALAATLHRDFDLAILDVRMPGMDGYELAELLRGDPKTQAIPIIFVTAASIEEEHVFKGYDAGAVDYIIKPFNPRILASRVRILLEMQAQKKDLQRSREALAAINRELEAFAYSVSHDLRAPLRAIEGFSEALLSDHREQLDAGGRDYLRRVAEAAQRMEQLIDALLALSRVTRAPLGREAVDLGEHARQIVERLQAAEPDRAVELRIGEGLAAVGDPRLLHQELENLLANAWKFTGRVTPARIEVGRTARDGRACFFVKDNGAGFEMKRADKLFAPFQRLHDAAEFPGTGVGLSTVQRIVARHGGRIWCESAVGRGTTFFFTLGA